jgi:hypothetical protein
MGEGGVMLDIGLMCDSEQRVISILTVSATRSGPF